MCIYGFNSHLEYAVLRVSWRKNPKTFPCDALLLYVVHELFIQVFQTKKGLIMSCSKLLKNELGRFKTGSGNN